MHAITLDSKYGVPTVAIHTNAFEKVVQSVTRMHGMPQARYTFVPQPVMGKTAEQLRAYVDGKSPISGRPVMQEVIEGLTRPAEGDRHQGDQVRALDAETGRFRLGRKPASPVPGQQLDRQTADCSADGKARSGNAGAHEPEAGRSRGALALESISPALGVHG